LAGLVFAAGAGSTEFVDLIAAAGVKIVVVGRGSSIGSVAGKPRWSEDQRGLTDLDSARAYVTEENLLGVSPESGKEVVGYPDGYSSVVHELAHLVFEHVLSSEQRIAAGVAHAEMLKAEQRARGDAESGADYPATSVEERFAQALTVFLDDGLDDVHPFAELLAGLYVGRVSARGNNIAGALAEDLNLGSARDLYALADQQASQLPAGAPSRAWTGQRPLADDEARTAATLALTQAQENYSREFWAVWNNSQSGSTPGSLSETAWQDPAPMVGPGAGLAAARARVAAASRALENLTSADRASGGVQWQNSTYCVGDTCVSVAAFSLDPASAAGFRVRRA
jgi:hypothetical protein